MGQRKLQQARFSIDELCNLTGLTKRTVRYYLQIGLIEKPLGEKRGSYYEERHLNQLLRIKQLSEAGVSLERIRLVLGVRRRQFLPPCKPLAL